MTDAKRDPETLAERLEQAVKKLPRPWIDGGVTPTEWAEAFDVIDEAIAALRQRPQEDIPIDVMDSLHAVFTRHGIASRTQTPLAGDVIRWAAQAMRQSQRQERHRCVSCGLRWEGIISGAEYCGDCHAKAFKVLHPPDSPQAPEERPDLIALEKWRDDLRAEPLEWLQERAKLLDRVISAMRAKSVRHSKARLTPSPQLMDHSSSSAEEK